jgi:hypothetical protein
VQSEESSEPSMIAFVASKQCPFIEARKSRITCSRSCQFEVRTDQSCPLIVPAQNHLPVESELHLPITDTWPSLFPNCIGPTSMGTTLRNNASTPRSQCKRIGILTAPCLHSLTRLIDVRRRVLTRRTRGTMSFQRRGTLTLMQAPFSLRLHQ